MQLRTKRSIAACLFAGAVIALAANVHAAQSEIEAMLTRLTPSAGASLLGPVDETGRTGWTCLPEIQARAQRPADSALPEPER